MTRFSAQDLGRICRASTSHNLKAGFEAIVSNISRETGCPINVTRLVVLLANDLDCAATFLRDTDEDSVLGPVISAPDSAGSWKRRIKHYEHFSPDAL